jgi:Spy/CpxP family protein refolding chaperone
MAVTLLLALPVSLVVAQPLRPPAERHLERVEHFKKVRLIEILDMKEDQSVRFFARMNEHEKMKRELMQEKMKALDKIERLVRNKADEKEFEAIFPEVAAVEGRIAEEDRNFQLGLRDVLSAEQRAKFLLFERQFERELREAMREVQRRRHRMDEP